MTDDEARALDRQVALALGYTEDIFDWAYGGDSDHIVKANCWSLPDGRHTYQGSLPHFSTDIKTAWTVVEAMQAQEWTITLFTGISIDGAWMCGMYRNRHEKTGDATCPTAPEAICRAAVEALQETTKGHME